MRVGSWEMPVIDVDTHVIEAPDLWTSRLPKKWADQAPQLVWDAEVNTLMWTFAGKRVFPALSAAHAGWHECAPSHPARWEEADPATWEVGTRVARMDEYGIDVQILYPNVAMFTLGNFRETGDIELQNALIRVYNDWQYEWCSPARERFAPMISVPFWDLQETETEIDRCIERGFRGIVFSQDPTAFGLPALIDPHWDRLWAMAQERRMSINFHIGSANDDVKRADLINRHTAASANLKGKNAQAAYSGAMNFLSNTQTISQLIMSGICHRFPELNFVSVESGAGYVKFVLETLDWQWQNNGLAARNPGHLLPTEYFERQIYATFWFERLSAIQAIQALGSTNVMYETDFPHPTSMSPGPGSLAAVSPDVYVNEVLGVLPEDDLRNILYRNAARVYQLDEVLGCSKLTAPR